MKTPHTNLAQIRDRALRYAEFGTNAAAAIRDALYTTPCADAEELLLYSSRLELCNSNQNQWYAEDLHRKDGECYNGAGRFWACGHKLCSYCLKRQTNRARSLIRAALDRQRLRMGEKYSFLTLTIVNNGLPVLEQRRLINASWAIFRKTHWFRSKIVGAAKLEEFTTTKRGYHYHQHLLARTKYIDYKEMRRNWTTSAIQAHRELGVPLQIDTKDGLLLANCKTIHDEKRQVNEVAKYITKACSWSQMPPDDLLQMCRIERWPRMFELIGSFKPSARKALTDDTDALNNVHILDERVISEDRKPRPWRRRIAERGAIDYLAELTEHFERQCEFRRIQLRHKYHAAKFWTLKPNPPPDPLVIIRRSNEIDALLGAKLRSHVWSSEKLAERRAMFAPTETSVT